MSSNSYYGFTPATPQYGTNYSQIPTVPQSSAYSMAAPQGYPPSAYGQSYQQQTTQTTGMNSYSYPSQTQTSVPISYDNSNGQTGQYTQGYQYDTTNAANTYTNTYNSIVTNYAASSLYPTSSSTPEETNSSAAFSSGKSSSWNFRKNIKGKPKTPAKVQLHYCEVCKISCAGPQTYKEHLDGQRHKKKEALLKTGSPSGNKRQQHIGGVALRCELCDVTCTGQDAYTAHVRGSKHQKVHKLHTKLGKPIPENNPTVVGSNGKHIKGVKPPGTQTGSSGKIKVVGTPRINFTSGGRLHTTMTGEVKEESYADQAAEMEAQAQTEETCKSSELEKVESATPVGQDYVEEITSEDGKAVSYHCKLCDCKFNDPAAKEMHLKGRRHRLQYKRKVDPHLIVDQKPSCKQRKLLDSKDRRLNMSYKKDAPYYADWYGGRYDTRQLGPSASMPHMMPPLPPLSPFMNVAPAVTPFRRTSSSWDDSHIMHKHLEICPKEDELDEMHHVLSCTERALKLVSDKLAEDDAAVAINEVIKNELTGDLLSSESTTVEAKSEVTGGIETDKEAQKPDVQQYRLLKGLMRVGPLAKGLLLSSDKEVDLVVICADKPTRYLLQRIADHLPQQLQTISAAESFEIVMKPHEAGLSITSSSPPKISVNVSFTSPLIREEKFDDIAQPEMVKVKDPNQMLDRQKCLDALAALRHAKWFQARAANLYPCSMVIRLLRDLCKRLPTWSKLTLWSIELLCEKVISSAGEPLSPGEALRHTFEAIASGILLTGGAGLVDPCEKEPTDALAYLSRQEREDITSSAQHALRLMAFRQIYKILGVDPIHQRNSANNKRRVEAMSESVTENESGISAKKVKKEDDNSLSNESDMTSLVDKELVDD